MKRKQRTYNWRQIEQCIVDIYEVDSHRDDWNVPVVYEEQMLEVLKKRLRYIKGYVK